MPAAPSSQQKALRIELKQAATGAPMPLVSLWIVDTDKAMVADTLGMLRIPLDSLEQDTVCLMFRYYTANDTTICLSRPTGDTTLTVYYPDKKKGGWR